MYNLPTNVEKSLRKEYRTVVINDSSGYYNNITVSFLCSGNSGIRHYIRYYDHDGRMLIGFTNNRNPIDEPDYWYSPCLGINRYWISRLFREQEFVDAFGAMANYMKTEYCNKTNVLHNNVLLGNK